VLCQHFAFGGQPILDVAPRRITAVAVPVIRSQRDLLNQSLILRRFQLVSWTAAG
jgi:hypothetical protein